MHAKHFCAFLWGFSKNSSSVVIPTSHTRKRTAPDLILENLLSTCKLSLLSALFQQGHTFELWRTAPEKTCRPSVGHLSDHSRFWPKPRPTSTSLQKNDQTICFRVSETILLIGYDTLLLSFLQQTFCLRKLSVTCRQLVGNLLVTRRPTVGRHWVSFGSSSSQLPIFLFELKLNLWVA